MSATRGWSDDAVRLKLIGMQEVPTMAKEATNMTPKTETRIDRNGFVPGVAHLALDVVDRGQTTAIALLHDARGEVRAVVEGGIELAEKATTSVFRFARKATTRIDEGVAETLSSLERVIASAVRAARDTTRAATDLAGTAIGGVAGGTAAASA
jgi:hypothetical protein